MDNPEVNWQDIERFNENRFREALSQTFEAVAKTALRAAAEFKREPETNALEQLRNAHSLVTMTVDELMRGLNDATLHLLGTTIARIEQRLDEHPK